MPIPLQSQKQLLLSHLQKSGAVKSKKILSAFSKVKREDFVSEKYKSQAYEDHPLPVGKGATISQPSTIAVMLELLDLKKDQKVLEIGSGCGYVLALISEIVGKKGKVFGIEINENLVKLSQKILENKKNIKIIAGDGRKGLAKEAPFDRILVSAGAEEIPQKLIEQLSPQKGIMVIPVGPFYGTQKMLKIIKNKNKLDIQEKGHFVFVPLIKK